MAKFSSLYEVEILEAEADARATFDIADKMGLDGPGSAFNNVTLAVKIVSPAPEEAVAALMEHAERACHTSHSLRQIVPVELTYTLERGESHEEREPN